MGLVSEGAYKRLCFLTGGEYSKLPPISPGGLYISVRGFKRAYRVNGRALIRGVL